MRTARKVSSGAEGVNKKTRRPAFFLAFFDPPEPGPAWGPGLREGPFFESRADKVRGTAWHPENYWFASASFSFRKYSSRAATCACACPRCVNPLSAAAFL